jgi:hypothetical protein
VKKPPDSPTFARFTSALQTIMKVPKAAVQKASEKEKAERRAAKESPSKPRA